MNNNESIFNFESNSYSKFLNTYSSDASYKSQSPSHEGDEFILPNDIFLQMYKIRKKHAQLYKCIFYGLAIVFFILAFIVYFNTTNWACSLYFQNCAFVKSSTYSLCFFLGLTAGGYGYSIHPEKETAQYLLNRMVKSLKDSYKRRKMEVSFILNFHSDGRKKRLFFKQNYYKTLEKMKEQKQHAFHLLEKISLHPYESEDKDQMINQALSDLQKTLNSALQSFKQKNYLLTMNAGTQ